MPCERNMAVTNTSRYQRINLLCKNTGL